MHLPPVLDRLYQRLHKAWHERAVSLKAREETEILLVDLGVELPVL